MQKSVSSMLLYDIDAQRRLELSVMYKYVSISFTVQKYKTVKKMITTNVYKGN